MLREGGCLSPAVALWQGKPSSKLGSTQPVSLPLPFQIPTALHHLFKTPERTGFSKKRLRVFLQQSPATLHFLFQRSEIPHLYLQTPTWASHKGSSTVTNNFLLKFNKWHAESKMEYPKLGRGLVGWEPDLPTVPLPRAAPGEQPKLFLSRC